MGKGRRQAASAAVAFFSFFSGAVFVAIVGVRRQSCTSDASAENGQCTSTHICSFMCIERSPWSRACLTPWTPGFFV